MFFRAELFNKDLRDKAISEAEVISSVKFNCNCQRKRMAVRECQTAKLTFGDQATL